MRNLITLFLIITVFSGFSQKRYLDLKSEYDSSVECLGTGTDGVLVFKVFILNKKRKLDTTKMKKAALFNVLFNGITGVPSVGCKTQPPLLKDSDYEKNSDYFKDFFKTGKFLQFISYSNSATPDIVKMNNNKFKGYRVGMTVTVRRDDIAKKLEEDGIRKGLSNYF